MDKDKTSKKQNRSMFLYTALIFAVALILIIIAFFGQKNIRGLRERTRQDTAAATAADTENTTETAAVTQAPAADDLAITANALAAAQDENTELKARIDTYEKLLAANAKAEEGSFTEAETLLAELSVDTLNEEQQILYNQIEEKINNGKEQ